VNCTAVHHTAVHHNASAALAPARHCRAQGRPASRKGRARARNLDETVNEVLRFVQQSIVCHVPGIDAGGVVRIATMGQLA
jgi:hypothetical protein